MQLQIVRDDFFLFLFYFILGLINILGLYNIQEYLTL